MTSVFCSAVGFWLAVAACVGGVSFPLPAFFFLLSVAAFPRPAIASSIMVGFDSGNFEVTVVGLNVSELDVLTGSVTENSESLGIVLSIASAIATVSSSIINPVGFATLWISFSNSSRVPCKLSLKILNAVSLFSACHCLRTSCFQASLSDSCKTIFSAWGAREISFRGSKYIFVLREGGSTISRLDLARVIAVAI